MIVYKKEPRQTAVQEELVGGARSVAAAGIVQGG